MEKLEKELAEMNDQCLLLEMQNKRQTLELQAAKDLKAQASLIF
jgi:hypothetical protein